MNNDFDPARVQAILFDIDGTLADTDDVFVEKLTRLFLPLTRLWPQLPARRWARRLLMAAETPMNLIYTWWDRTYLDELTAPLFGLLPKRTSGQAQPPVLVPGVRDMLALLHQKYLLAVVTARGKAHGHRFLLDAEIEEYFQVIVTTRSVRRAKPHPAPVLYAAEQLEIPAKHCLMVGDTTLDVRAGQAAGAQTVAVLCGLGEREELARLSPSLLLDTTGDLPQYL